MRVVPNARAQMQAAALAVVFAFAPPAFAAAQRTFVASTGSDAYPCSVSLPCRSFVAAMAQTLSGGEIVVQDSAGYGAVTIAQSVSIISPPGIYAGISVTSGNGVTVGGTNAVVTLKGLAITGQGASTGHGIYVNGSNARVFAENITVTGMTFSGVAAAYGTEVVVRRAVLAGNQIGASVDVGASLILDDVQLVRNAQYGAQVQGGASLTIARSLVAGNGSTGISAAYPGTSTQLSVDRTAIVDNGGMGAYVESAGAGGETRGSFARSTIARNSGTGIVAKGAQSSFTYVAALGNVIEGNAAQGIAAGCYTSGRATANASANTVTRNNYSGLSASGGAPGDCVVRTIGRNMVRDTFGPDLVSVTKVAGD
jgi:hypothetical protein